MADTRQETRPFISGCRSPDSDTFLIYFYSNADTKRVKVFLTPTKLGLRTPTGCQSIQFSSDTTKGSADQKGKNLAPPRFRRQSQIPGSRNF